MLDVAVPEPCLEGPRIVAGVRQGEIAGMPEHVCGWIGNGIPARSPRRAISVWKLLGVIGPPRSEVNTCGLGGCSLQTAQGTDLVTLNWMEAWCASFTPADVQAPGIELDLVPLQIADFGGPKTVSIGDQDHGRIAMPVPARFARHRHQLLDLGAGEILPGPTN